ncbi:MAG: FAD-dependent thymidylate synthase [candidate division KSB1 bacterium]|nr:FAD-dependent thymidylate synthase [candidate division KSB1 bacterium]
MEELKEIQVLDRGFVRLVDFMGGDEAVVQAARVSTGQGSKGPERDRALIDYLLSHRHETPFEHSVFKFHVRCPIFVARQWFRHRMASYNEVSGRYTELKDEFHLPSVLRTQVSKDYRYEPLPEEKVAPLLRKISEHYESSYRLYQELLEAGVAREQARIVLPLALYTEFYWTVNARSLMNFLSLRAEAHAQEEIRAYANAILEIFRQKMPWTYEAFMKYWFKPVL